MAIFWAATREIGNGGQKTTGWRKKLWRSVLRTYALINADGLNRSINPNDVAADGRRHSIEKSTGLGVLYGPVRKSKWKFRINATRRSNEPFQIRRSGSLGRAFLC